MWADIKDVKDKKKINISWLLTGCDGEERVKVNCLEQLDGWLWNSL